MLVSPISAARSAVFSAVKNSAANVSFGRCCDAQSRRDRVEISGDGYIGNTNQNIYNMPRAAHGGGPLGRATTGVTDAEMAQYGNDVKEDISSDGWRQLYKEKPDGTREWFGESESLL